MGMITANDHNEKWNDAEKLPRKRFKFGSSYTKYETEEMSSNYRLSQNRILSKYFKKWKIYNFKYI